MNKRVKKKLTKNRLFYGLNEDDFTIKSREAIRGNMDCISEEDEDDMELREEI